MLGGGREEDDDGFLYYHPNTIDLGYSLLVGAVLAFIIGYAVILPFFVILSRRRAARRRDREAVNHAFCVEDLEDDAADRQDSQNENHELAYTSPYHNNPRDLTTDQEETGLSMSTSSSQNSGLSSAVAAILDRPQVPRSKSKRKRKRRKDQQLQETRRIDDPVDPNTFDLMQAIHPSRRIDDPGDLNTFNLMQGIHPGGIRSVARPPAVDEATSFVEVQSSPPITSPSAQMAPPERPTPKYAEDYNSLGMLDKIGMIAAWDIEMKRILRLSAPYCTQALITGLTDTMNVAVIGKLIGTKEVSAYVTVNLLVELTSEFVGGLHEALATLCSQAIGAKNKKLAGQYCQIVCILYTLCFIPFMVLWAVYMETVLRWMDFDEETVAIGKQYNYILIFDLMIDGLGETVHGLLDVGGLENFSTLIGATEEILASVTLLLVGLFGTPDLVAVGLIQLGMGLWFLVLNIFIIYFKGWFIPYREGMLGSFALFNGKAVWLVARTGLSLSFGMLLTDGEWEVLMIFASFLGPAEVAAWGILDTIFQATHELIDGMADASEVRCAYLLGSGDPARAKVSACKSTLVGIFFALFLTSFIYMAGDDLPTWLTNDPTLQTLLSDLLPLFGLANLVMALDTMSWTLLGSQGRYRLATIIVGIISWLITIPLAVLFSVHLNVNLQGQMTAFVTGYIVMGVTHSYFLLTSDWDKLSMMVMDDNEAVRLMTLEAEPNNLTADASKLTSTSASGGSPAMLPKEVASGMRTIEDRC